MFEVPWPRWVGYEASIKDQNFILSSREFSERVLSEMNFR